MKVDERLHHFMYITFIGFMYFKVVLVVVVVTIIIINSSNSSSRLNICGWVRHRFHGCAG